MTVAVLEFGWWRLPAGGYLGVEFWSFSEFCKHCSRRKALHVCVYAMEMYPLSAKHSHYL